MDLLPYLSVIILVTTIATILLALVSYAGFKIRNKRGGGSKGGDDEPLFFRVYEEEEPEPE